MSGEKDIGCGIPGSCKTQSSRLQIKLMCALLTDSATGLEDCLPLLVIGCFELGIMPCNFSVAGGIDREGRRILVY